MSRIIVGTSAALLLVVLPLAAQPPKPPVAATVNGEEIPLTQVDAFIRTKLAIIPVTEGQLKQSGTEVLAGLIDDLVLKQFLTKSALRSRRPRSTNSRRRRSPTRSPAREVRSRSS